MKRISFAFLAVLSVGTASADYEPRPGQWKLLIVFKDDARKNHNLLLTSSSYPVACVDLIKPFAEKLEKSNGFVWTDSDRRVLSHNKSDLAHVKNEVIEIKCAFEAFKEK